MNLCLSLRLIIDGVEKKRLIFFARRLSNLGVARFQKMILDGSVYRTELMVPACSRIIAW